MTKLSLKQLRKKNNNLDKKLSKENQKINLDMIVYLRGSKISERKQEEIREDILDIFLSAQDRGEKAEVFIGEDYKVFMDNIIANTIPMTRQEEVHYWVSIITAVTAALIMILLIQWYIYTFFDEKPFSWQVPITDGILVLIISAPILSILGAVLITKKTYTKSLKNLGAVVLFVGFIGLIIMQVFLRNILFTVHLAIIVAIIVILYLVAYLTDPDRKY